MQSCDQPAQDLFPYLCVNFFRWYLFRLLMISCVLLKCISMLACALMRVPLLSDFPSFLTPRYIHSCVVVVGFPGLFG